MTSYSATSENEKQREKKPKKEERKKGKTTHRIVNYREYKKNDPVNKNPTVIAMTEA